MNRFRSWAGDLLHLGPGEWLEIVQETTPPASDVGLGLTPGADMSLREIVDRPGFFARTSRLAIPSGDWRAWIRLERSDDVPGVIILKRPQGFAGHEGGGLLTRDGDLILDGRVGPALARFQFPEEEFVFCTQGGASETYRRRREPGTVTSAGVPDSESDPRTDPPLPEVPRARFLDGVPAPEWLLDEAEELAESPSAYHRAAAAGMVARLWRSEGAEDGAPPGGPNPAEDVSAWAQALTLDQREAIERMAFLEADRVSGLADELASALDEDDVEASEDLGELLFHARDDLESVRWVLVAAQCGEGLTGVTESLDLEARRRLPAIAFLERAFDEPRLRAAASVEPGAWWGAA